jgi:hypothetical protein
MPAIPALGRLRQQDHEIKASLSHIMRERKKKERKKEGKKERRKEGRKEGTKEGRGRKEKKENRHYRAACCYDEQYFLIDT